MTATLSVFWSLFKVALILGSFVAVSVCIFMKGKPLLAFYLFVKDRLKEDRHEYKGFGFWLFCGLGGSGKTISMVEYLARVRRAYPKVKIYTNFDCVVSDGNINSWQDIINKENYELVVVSEDEWKGLDTYNRAVNSNGELCKKKHNGIIFGFDEIHLTFASQNWVDCPDNMLEYISQQRKLHKQIIASSQVFTRIDKKLREQTNYVVECKSVFGSRLVFNRYFNTAEYLAGGELADSGKRRRKRAKRYSFVATDYIRSLYNTYQVMKDLSTGKGENQAFTDELKRRLGIQ